MNKKVDINAEIIRTLIEENRPFLTPLATIFVGIILVIFFVIPQFNGFSAKQDELNTEREKLRKLQNSLLVLNSTSEGTLEKNLEVSSATLPPEKDFALILNALSSAASFSGVSLGDFDFQIGNLSGNANIGTAVPSIRITLNISGSVESTVDFIRELSKTVPVSQVSGVKSGGSFSSIDLLFYYKPFPPQNSVNPQNIVSISENQQKLINDIFIPPAVSPVNSSPSAESL